MRTGGSEGEEEEGAHRPASGAESAQKGEKRSREDAQQ